MHRTVRWLALGSAVLLLAACSHPNKNAPLTYVPADTPYVMANLKPMTDEAIKSLAPTSASTTLWKAKVAQLHGLADRLDASHQTHLASLVRAILDTAHGRTWAQMQAHTGIDTHGLFAFFGLGLSPVGRGQLSDPAKFKAWIAKLEKAYGKTFTNATLDQRSYQHLVLEQSGLELLIATHDKQFVVALLPATPSSTQLRLALGLDRPKHSLQHTQRLAKLAKAEGYGPYLVSYLDLTKLPALVAGFKDPFLQAAIKAIARRTVEKRNTKQHTDVSASQVMSELRKKLPAACEPGLARIAARVPLISFGYTKLDQQDRAAQLDIRLAPDIVKAFAGVGTEVPGLGQDSAAPLDLAMALPVPAFRKFWMAQAEAVAAKPFICPGLSGLNKMFAKMQAALPKTAMPPFGGLRGFRLILDKIDIAKLAAQHKNGSPAKDLQARVLVASHNPAGLWGLAKASIPALAQLTLNPDGKPVALPANITAKAGVPAWVAMNGQAIAIGIGQGEQARLSSMLGAATAAPGTLAHAHVAGEFYVHALQAIDHQLAQQHASDQSNRTNVHARMAEAIAEAQRLKSVSSHAGLTDNGIRIRSDEHWK